MREESTVHNELPPKQKKNNPLDPEAVDSSAGCVSSFTSVSLLTWLRCGTSAKGPLLEAYLAAKLRFQGETHGLSRRRRHHGTNAGLHFSGSRPLAGLHGRSIGCLQLDRQSHWVRSS